MRANGSSEEKNNVSIDTKPKKKKSFPLIYNPNPTKRERSLGKREREM